MTSTSALSHVERNECFGNTSPDTSLRTAEAVWKGAVEKETEELKWRCCLACRLSYPDGRFDCSGRSESTGSCGDSVCLSLTPRMVAAVCLLLLLFAEGFINVLHSCVVWTSSNDSHHIYLPVFYYCFTRLWGEVFANLTLMIVLLTGWQVK